MVRLSYFEVICGNTEINHFRQRDAQNITDYKIIFRAASPSSPEVGMGFKICKELVVIKAGQKDCPAMQDSHHPAIFPPDKCKRVFWFGNVGINHPRKPSCPSHLEHRDSVLEKNKHLQCRKDEQTPVKVYVCCMYI